MGGCKTGQRLAILHFNDSLLEPHAAQPHVHHVATVCAKAVVDRLQEHSICRPQQQDFPKKP